MKASRFFIPLTCLLLAPAAFAAGPVEKRQDSYYSRLWSNSPFTTKPDVPPPTEKNPFEDYALSAVMPLPRGGYMVVVQNKKKPDERLTILPDQPSDFKLVEVLKGDGKPRSMSVKLSNASGSKTGTVLFDEKLLTIKQPVQKNPGNPNNPNNPNGAGVPVPGAPGAPVANNPNPVVTTGNPGAPTTGGFEHRGGGNNGGGGFNNNSNNTNTSSAAGVRPPRPRVVPSQGGGNGSSGGRR
ncbi:MAG: hypothetical protein QM755_16665 [Luteolibacter sp.]